MNEVENDLCIGPNEVVAERIMHFIDEMNGAASAKSIEKGVKGKNKTIYAALNTLVESSILIKKGNGGKGDPISYQKREWMEDDIDRNSQQNDETVLPGEKSLLTSIYPLANGSCLEITADQFSEIVGIIEILDTWQQQQMKVSAVNNE